MLEHENQQPESTAQTIRQAVRFLRVLWHRRIVVMGTLALCGMLGGLYYATATRIYEAEAQLLVVDTSRENSPTSMTGSHSDIAAMATYEKLVSSPLVLQSAATLLDAPVRSLFGSQDPEVLAEDFSKELNVRGFDRQTCLNSVSVHHTRKPLLQWLQQSFRLMPHLWMSPTGAQQTQLLICFKMKKKKSTRRLK
jgi:hypothetical protein